jgi:hypothetical protein
MDHRSGNIFIRPGHGSVLVRGFAVAALFG